MPNAKNKAQVENLSQILEQYKHFVVISFDKTPHKEMEGLKKHLKKNGAYMRVLKTSLFEKAVEKMAESNEAMKKLQETAFPIKGSSAMVGFGEAWYDGLKSYYENAKKDESLEFKFGFIDNEVYQKEGLVALSKLPSKAELMAKLIGTMKAPMMKTTFALKYNMQRFVTVLSEKAKQG